MHSHNRAIENRPHALYAVGVDIVPDVFLCTVIVALVSVEQALQRSVGSVLVCVDLGTYLDVRMDFSSDRIGIGDRDGAGLDLAVPLFQFQHRLLSHRAPSLLQFLGLVLVRLSSANILLIGLDDSRQRLVLVSTGFLDALEHVPGRLLRSVQFLCKLQRRYALARHASLVHDP